MTSLNVRSAKVTTIRTDAVVIGLVSTAQGIAAHGPGADVAKAFGRGFVPMLASLGFEAKPGQVATLPSGHVLRSPVVVAVGLGAEGPSTTRRCGAPPRSGSRPPRTPSRWHWRCPPATPPRCARSARARCWGCTRSTATAPSGAATLRPTWSC